jgi:hypothetical protein
LDPAAPTGEAALYGPVKAFLEGQGYQVKGEIDRCDVVAVRGDEDPVIVELKTRFSLTLLFQAVERQAMTDQVYVAIAVTDAGQTVWRRHHRVLRLCRRLGLGLLTVHLDRRHVEPRLDPAPHQPRKSKLRRTRLLKEFAERVGDPTPGGSNRRPVVTAYRQDALRLADLLARLGPQKVSSLRELTGVARAGRILQGNVYGWFDRTGRGVYSLSPRGQSALSTFADQIPTPREA